MIEVYANTSEKIELRLYLAGERANSESTVTLTVTDADTGDILVGDPTPIDALVETGAVNGVTGIETYYYITSLSVSTQPRMLYIDWNFSLDTGVIESGTKRDVVKVVVPYVTPDEIRNEFPELADKTIDELKAMERTVRGRIDTYCSQSFGREIGKTRTVLGKGQDWLALYDRMYELTGIRLEYDDTSTTGDESVDLTTYVRKDPDNFWQIRQKKHFLDDEIDDYNLFRSPFFKAGRVYQVTGNWGWEYVPDGVNQAAKLLVAAQFCPESNYRDKWLANIRSADWRLEFAAVGNETTGSADADAILWGYRNENLVVI